MSKRFRIAVDVLLVIFVMSTAWHLWFRNDKQAGVRRGPVPGVSLNALNVEWSSSNRYLLVLLRDGCHYCEESITFIKAASARNPRVRLIPVFSQGMEEARKYLKEKDMSDQFVVAKAKMPWGSFATPTFLLCDSKGIVLKYWVGKPSAVAEEEILKALSEN